MTFFPALLHSKNVDNKIVFECPPSFLMLTHMLLKQYKSLKVVIQDIEQTIPPPQCFHSEETPLKKILLAPL